MTKQQTIQNNAQKKSNQYNRRKSDLFGTYINSEKPWKLEKPQLQWADLTSVRQYVKYEPSTKVYHSLKILGPGISSVVWQHQLGKASIER